VPRFVIAAVVPCFGAVVRAQESFPQFEKRVHKEGEKKLPYRLLVPKAYEPGTALPLIVWLHGSGEKATDNVSPAQPSGLRSRKVTHDRLPTGAECPVNASAPVSRVERAHVREERCLTRLRLR
jgi:hypothetical protein